MILDWCGHQAHRSKPISKSERPKITPWEENFFKKLDDVEVVRLEPGTADIDPSTQLAIFLGNDYAALKSA